MSFVKNIQGLGEKTSGYLGSILPNKKDYTVINNYDTVSPYNGEEYNNPVSMMFLFKIDPLISNNVFLLSSRQLGNKGFYILVVTANGTIRYGSSDSNSFTANNIGSNLSSINGKWNTLVVTNEGLGTTDGISVFINGMKSSLFVLRNTPITGTILQPDIRLGKDISDPHDHQLAEIAILTIYKGILTDEQIVQFNTDPFGFNNSLAAIDCNLRVDYNRTTGEELLDTSSSSFTITSTGDKNFSGFA